MAALLQVPTMMAAPAAILLLIGYLIVRQNRLEQARSARHRPDKRQDGADHSPSTGAYPQPTRTKAVRQPTVSEID